MHTNYDILKKIVGEVNWTHLNKTVIITFNYKQVEYTAQYKRDGMAIEHVNTHHDSKTSMQSEVVLEVLRKVTTLC